MHFLQSGFCWNCLMFILTQHSGVGYHIIGKVRRQMSARPLQSNLIKPIHMTCIVLQTHYWLQPAGFISDSRQIDARLVCGKSLLSSAPKSLMSPTAQSNTLINFLQHYACQSNKLKLSSVTKGNPSQAVINLVLCLNCNVIRAWQTKTCKIQSINMATSQQYYDICTHREVIWGVGIKGPMQRTDHCPFKKNCKDLLGIRWSLAGHV